SGRRGSNRRARASFRHPADAVGRGHVGKSSRHPPPTAAGARTGSTRSDHGGGCAPRKTRSGGLPPGGSGTRSFTRRLWGPRGHARAEGALQGVQSIHVGTPQGGLQTLLGFARRGLPSATPRGNGAECAFLGRPIPQPVV